MTMVRGQVIAKLDEYEPTRRLLLSRLDNVARIAVKPDAPG